MSAPRRELYVYYRVAPSRWREAVAAVQEKQRRLRTEHAGLTARVLRRPSEDNGAVTLMEVYACDASPGDFDALLEARLAESAVTPADWLLGERHIERFDTLE